MTPDCADDRPEADTTHRLLVRQSSAVQYSAVQCSAVQCSAVHTGIIRATAMGLSLPTGPFPGVWSVQKGTVPLEPLRGVARRKRLGGMSGEERCKGPPAPPASSLAVVVAVYRDFDACRSLQTMCL